MRGCHPSKIVVRDGEYYCGPYRVFNNGYYVAQRMVNYDSLTPEQRKRWHLEDDANARIHNEFKMKKAGL